jgi:hypothetical protein
MPTGSLSGTMGFTGEMTFGDGIITNTNISTSAEVARSKLALETKTYTIPITSCRVWDSMALLLGATAGSPSADDMGIITGVPGTAVPTLNSIDWKGTSPTEKCAFEFPLPAEYDDAKTITLRVRAAMLTTVSDGTATIDAQCYASNRDGVASADLVSTAAQSMKTLTPANYDFVVTPTSRAAGDRLVFVLAFGGADTGAAGVMISEISEIELLVGVRG